MEQRVQGEDEDTSFLKINYEGLLCGNLCVFNPQALELSAQYTLEKTQDLIGCSLLCMFLVTTLVDVQTYQHHNAF